MAHPFPPFDVAVHLAIAVAIGMLVGLEREWSQKDLGSRTFGITAMAGTLSVLAGSAFASLTFAGFLMIVALAAFRNIRDGKRLRQQRQQPSLLRFSWVRWWGRATITRLWLRLSL